LRLFLPALPPPIATAFIGGAAHRAGAPRGGVESFALLRLRVGASVPTELFSCLAALA